MSLISILKKKSKKTFFTTPSHSGKKCIFHKFYQWYRSDISETEAYNPEEALRKAEENAARIYGTRFTYFLTNGSTSGIIAAVLASCNNESRLLIWENAHQCHKNAGKLAGAEIITYKLPYNEKWGIYESLKPSEYEKLLSDYCPNAIIITSPTYEGLTSDVKQIANICKKRNVTLIVDEAHGALYPFSDELPESAVKYADFTIQSLHKTAGGINPTALLHSNCNYNVVNTLKMINTTSPSYPMLATIEANINYLNSKRGRENINSLIFRIKNVRAELTNFDFYGDDVTKLLIKKYGISGFELSEILYDRFGIEDERTNEKSTLLLTGIGTTKEKLNKLYKLKNL